jgi:hypothetical protein
VTRARGFRGKRRVFAAIFPRTSEVPGHLHAKIIAASKAERGAEEAEEV